MLGGYIFLGGSAALLVVGIVIMAKQRKGKK